MCPEGQIVKPQGSPLLGEVSQGFLRRGVGGEGKGVACACQQTVRAVAIRKCHLHING